MRSFSKNELLAIVIILAAITAASLSNFRISLRRARDTQRKNDIGTLTDALVRYGGDFGSFPISQDGKIVACRGPETKIDKKGRITNLVACEWGKDSLADISNPPYPAYISTLPADPETEKGPRYIYFSNGRRFQFYASLEGADEAEYDGKILARKISCGSRICNFGLAYGNTPLDKSIEEYENELLRVKN